MRIAVVLLLFALLVHYPVLSQQGNDKGKMTRKERREAEKQKRIDQKEKTIQLLKSQEFVLEASRVVDRYGRTTFVTPNLNFIAFNDDFCTVQLSAFEGLAGWNDVGGITFDGKVRTFRINEGKADGDTFIEVRMTGAGIASNMLINVSPDGRGSVEFLGDRGAKLTFEGQIVPLSVSTVYKGRAINR